MTEGDVLQGELSAGLERGVQRKKDDFEHQTILIPGSHNRNDTNRTEFLVATGDSPGLPDFYFGAIA